MKTATPRWTPDEIVRSVGGALEAAKQLPGRTYEAAKSRRRALGVKVFTRWTRERMPSWSNISMNHWPSMRSASRAEHGKQSERGANSWASRTLLVAPGLDRKLSSLNCFIVSA